MYSLRFFKSCVAGLAVLIFASSGAHAVPVISLTGPATVGVGSGFDLNVLVTDVADLYGYQFDLGFDAAHFRVDRVSEGSLLQTGGSTFFDGGSFDNGQGLISFVLGTLVGPDAGVSGSGILATVHFTNLDAGASSFAVNNGILLNSRLDSIAFDTQSITIAAVPEPATLALMLAGTSMLAISGTWRRRRVIYKKSAGNI